MVRVHPFAEREGVAPILGRRVVKIHSTIKKKQKIALVSNRKRFSICMYEQVLTEYLLRPAYRLSKSVNRKKRPNPNYHTLLHNNGTKSSVAEKC